MPELSTEAVEVLVHAVKPLSDEGLGELLLRAAAENYYERIDWILALADKKGSFLSKILRLPPAELARLGKVLGIDDEDAIKPLLYREVPELPGWLDFFGTPMRAKHLDLNRRRVSPRALRASPHLRAVWGVRIFSFDPATREQLLDRCPVCERKFDFRRVLEPWSCARCLRIDHEGFERPAVDLRDYPQPLVEVVDQEALDFVTGLVDPDPGLRRAGYGYLHSDLESLSRGEVFEMAVSLCCAIIPEAGESPNSLWRPPNKEAYGRFTPELVARVGRTILGWPDEFHRLAGEVREQATARPGHFGLRKELGPLLKITAYKNVPKAVRDVVKHAIDDNMALTASSLPTVRRSWNRYRADLMTIGDAHQELGCTSRHMMRLGRRPEIEMIRSTASGGPVLFRRDQIETILRRKTRIVASQDVSNRLGIPRFGLRELAERGFIVREEGPVIDIMVGNDYYLTDSIDALIACIEEKVRIDKCPATHVRLRKAVNRLPVTPAGLWPTIIENILTGRLAVWRRRGRLAAVTSWLAVEHIAVLTSLFQCPEQSDDAFVLNQAETAQALRISPVNVNQLVTVGLLPRKIVSKDIERFSTKYVLTVRALELLLQRGRSTSTQILVRELRGAGVRPVLELPLTGRPVWLLEDIKRFFEEGDLTRFKLRQSTWMSACPSYVRRSTLSAKPEWTERVDKRGLESGCRTPVSRCINFSY